MPSSIIHRCVGKRVLEKGYLYKKNEDIFMYTVGLIAPDCWRNSIRFKNSELPKIAKRKYSHFSREGQYLEHYEDFFDKYRNCLSDPFMMGYLVHLITDFHWRTTMFFKCFDENGKIKLLDGSVVDDDKIVKKQLLHNENKKMSYLLSEYFKLDNINLLSMEELDRLPRMDEIEFDGLNETINYTNFEGSNNPVHQLIVFEIEHFIKGIEECSNYILNKLIELDVMKK